MAQSLGSGSREVTNRGQPPGTSWTLRGLKRFVATSRQRRAEKLASAPAALAAAKAAKAGAGADVDVSERLKELICLREPPSDALEQADGTFQMTLDDGATITWTRRPDGTWRRPEHRRAGWVGELEQAKYTPPTVRLLEGAGIGEKVRSVLLWDDDYNRDLPLRSKPVLTPNGYTAQAQAPQAPKPRAEAAPKKSGTNKVPQAKAKDEAKAAKAAKGGAGRGSKEDRAVDMELLPALTRLCVANGYSEQPVRAILGPRGKALNIHGELGAFGSHATEKSPPLGDCGARDARRALAMLLSCDVPDEDAVDAADASEELALMMKIRTSGVPHGAREDGVWRANTDNAWRNPAASAAPGAWAFESDIGKKILMKYGWREGQGLGRLKNGRTECVQGERREEKKGLGVEKRKSEEQWDNWWADCFNSVAKSISVKAESRAESSDSDSEAPEKGSEGGRITAVKKAGAMKGKLRRVLRQESSPAL
ncbi:G patch domain-containing protein 4 [Durusdinium trenchii]|uniref:G patch domain-containing protein 4 n=1 Tax=Durusdinium trenchii TaxID=1381693 RepID=A0ABP0PT98_9DINO